MTLVMYVVVTVLVATGLFFGIRYFVRAYVRYRDSPLIIRLENGEAAMVEVDDHLQAGLLGLLRGPVVCPRSC